MSVAPSITSSSQLWSQVRHANRANIYKVLAGVASRNEGSKLVIKEANISGRAAGENASIDV